MISKISLLAKWKRRCGIGNRNEKEEVYKVHLLQDESIRTLYQNRLNEQLSQIPSTENINEEWTNIKQDIAQAAYEALGKKQNHRKKKS